MNEFLKASLYENVVVLMQNLSDEFMEKELIEACLSLSDILNINFDYLPKLIREKVQERELEKIFNEMESQEESNADYYLSEEKYYVAQR